MGKLSEFLFNNNDQFEFKIQRKLCSTKGQEISKALFFGFNSPKKATIEDFLELINPNWHDKISLSYLFDLLD